MTMNHSAPLISIGMPVFNCAATLARAIRSIQRQSYQNWELLIIDDGSRDNTLEIARGFSDPRIHISAGGSNRGLAARLNEAVAASRGKYFARMDGDDVAYSSRLEVQALYLEHHPEIDLVGGSQMIYKGDGAVIGLRLSRQSHLQIVGTPWSTCILGHVTWMGHIEWFRRHAYREDTHRTEDRELLLRTHRVSKFAGIPDILVGVKEDRISIQKSYRARLEFSKALLRESFRQHDALLAVIGVPAEWMKFAFDCFAVTTGLSYRISPHRAQSCSPQHVSQLADLWKRTGTNAVDEAA